MDLLHISLLDIKPGQVTLHFYKLIGVERDQLMNVLHLLGVENILHVVKASQIH